MIPMTPSEIRDLCERSRQRVREFLDRYDRAAADGTCAAGHALYLPRCPYCRRERLRHIQHRRHGAPPPPPAGGPG